MFKIFEPKESLSNLVFSQSSHFYGSFMFNIFGLPIKQVSFSVLELCESFFDFLLSNKFARGSYETFFLCFLIFLQLCCPYNLFTSPTCLCRCCSVVPVFVLKEGIHLQPNFHSVSLTVQLVVNILLESAVIIFCFDWSVVYVLCLL